MLEEFDSFMTEYAEKNAGKESPKVLVLMGLPVPTSLLPTTAMWEAL